MIVVALVPALIALVGLLTYALSSNPKVAELGRLAFACGLLVVCLVLSREVVKLG